MQAVKAGSFGVDVVCATLDLQRCATCKAPRVSLDTFKKLMWFPDPQYKDASKGKLCTKPEDLTSQIKERD